MSDTNSEAPPAKKGKKGLILMIAAALLVVGGGGAGAWYFLQPKPQAGSEPQQAQAKKSRTFATLEPFTVNLSDPGGERFVQLSVVLEMADASASNSVTASVPAIRNALLLLLSTKSSQELLTVEGKTQLASEIALAAGEQLGWKQPGAAKALKTSAADKPAEKSEAHVKPDAGGTGAKEGKTVTQASQARDGPPNPVEGVHFVQFIVQ
ncbi:MAG: flagellar basal body-associated FliL family protein [Burkholderiaceae bacterium]|nr:flagellar basal body-associated FliL family protein [Burkholderiaceae bacterium]